MPKNTNKKDKNYLKMLIGGILSFFLLIIMIVILAGKVSYWQAWLYFAVNAIILVITIKVLFNKQDIISERLHPGKGMKWWDKIYFAASVPLWLFSIILAPLDVRFGWTQELPLTVYIISFILYIIGHSIFLWAKYTNKFFSSVVRIQKDRHHKVCQLGPYKFVRHPGYVGGIMFGIVTPIMLGSLLAVIPMAISLALLAVRTYLEDKTLREELHGYKEYAKKVKYRLLPGVW